MQFEPTIETSFGSKELVVHTGFYYSTPNLGLLLTLKKNRSKKKKGWMSLNSLLIKD